MNIVSFQKTFQQKLKTNVLAQLIVLNLKQYEISVPSVDDQRDHLINYS